MTELIVPIYKITVESFKYNDEVYTVAISPELNPEDVGLDFTGNYTGLLIDPNHGTYTFVLSPSGKDKWKFEDDYLKQIIKPEVLNRIGDIISRLQ